MASPEQLLVAILRSDHIQDTLFRHLSSRDISALRKSSSACCNLVTKHLFTRVHVSFDASTFTKPGRVAALGRVGHHVEHLIFSLPHTDATFLPPLVHPQTGQEISFLYSPLTSASAVLARPKYANTELGDILTQQYPPLFHAATNVPSFINALSMLPNMRHLTIHCPRQDPRERYRRDVVDYALISLRIAVERAPLPKLCKLSLSSLHASAFNYLRHSHGFGCVPSAGRRWGQITKLYISVDAWDFYGPSPGLDHLKIIDDYIRSFSPNLEKLSFTWLGRRGPCPVSLGADPLFAPPRTSKKLFHEVTSSMSPLPTPPARLPIHCPKLRHLLVRNATMNAPQLSKLISSHRPTVRDFDFENVVLANNGSWDEALAPLDADRAWSRSSLTPSASKSSLVTNDSSEELPSPSAAVEAASRELMNMDLCGLGFGDPDVYAEGRDGRRSRDLTEAREGCAGSSTKLTKKRIRRRRGKHRNEGHYAGRQDAGPTTPTPLRSRKRPRDCQLLDGASEIHDDQAGPFLPDPFITAPMLTADPQPVLLQPATYNPLARAGGKAGDDCMTAVQRNLEQEEAHRVLAEDAAARVSALRKAKQTVLAKLSREFCGRKVKARGMADAVAGLRDLGSICGSEVVLEDRRVLDSRSALVPLMFSRS